MFNKNVFKCMCFCVISYKMQVPANSQQKRMRLHRKRKLIKQRTMPTICEKTLFVEIVRINCTVFVCFLRLQKSCGYPRKNAYVCTAHQNSQNIVNCLEYEKKTTIIDNNANVFSLFCVGPGSMVNTDK